MTGLLLKDLYTLRQYLKTFSIMVLFFGFISLGMENPVVFYEGFLIIMTMMMSIYSFSYDALCKWDRYALSLPITRKDLVLSKYMLSLLLCICGSLTAFLISSLYMLFRPIENFAFLDHLIVSSVILCIAIFLSGLMLPLTFKFGVEKSRFFLIMICAAPTAFFIIMDKLGVGVPSENAFASFAKILPFLIPIIYFISFMISVKILNNKEI